MEDHHTTPAISSKVLTFVLLTSRLNRPKHQSGANFMWPTSKNDVVISLCTTVITLHSKYASCSGFCSGRSSYWRASVDEFHQSCHFQESGEASI